MKPNIEQLLREAPLRTPPERLSDRVQQALEEAEARGPRWYSAPVPLWACAVLAVLAGVLGYRGRSESSPPRVVYIMPVDGELARALVGAAQPREDDFFRKAQTRVITGRPKEF